MSKITRTIAALAISASIFTGLTMGCSASKKPLPPTPGPTPPKSITPTPKPSRKPVTNITQQSRTAVDQAKKVGGVNDAVAASDGKVVYVGISVKGKANINNVKRDVATRVRNNDRGVTKVLVTADPKLFMKIRDISVGIQKGKGISTFTKDFANLGKNITPTMK